MICFISYIKSVSSHNVEKKFLFNTEAKDMNALLHRKQGEYDKVEHKMRDLKANTFGTVNKRFYSLNSSPSNNL